MSRGRTEFRSRFLFPIENGSRLANVFVALCVGLPLVAACVAGAAFALDGARSLVSHASPLVRLSPRGSIPQGPGREAAAGVFAGASTPPVCKVEHQYYVSGKNGGWRTDQQYWLAEAAVFTADDGRAWEVDPAALRFDPPDMDVAGEALDAVYRQRIATMADGGRVLYACAGAGERVFLDACVGASSQRLERCADGDVSTITLGDGTARRRIRSHASDAAAQLAAGLALLVALALYARHAARAGALVDALRSWSAAPQPPSRTPVYVGLGLATLCAWGLVMLRASGASMRTAPNLAGYGLGFTAVAAALASAAWLWDRRAKLTIAIEPIERAETMRLARVGEGPAELAVRVRADAPSVTLADGSSHAYVRVNIKRLVQTGRNVTAYPLRAASWPARVPVEDPTGSGVLDLTGADVDFRSNYRNVSGAAAHALLKAYAKTPMGDLIAAAEPYQSLSVEESFIDAGEHLYVLGRVARVEDPDAQSNYRDMSTLPVIGSPAPARLVVFAGSERALLAQLTRERRVATAAVYALAASSGVLLALLAYLRALA